MLALTAIQDVLATLRQLKEGSGAEFQALRDRINLIREEPDHPRARGVVRRLPDQSLARCCSIPSPEGEWLLVWVLDDTVPPAVRLIVLERSDL